MAMESERLKVYGSPSALDRGDERDLEAARPADRWTEVSPGGPPERLLWLRLTSGAPGDPPDERYYADEVRPVGVDSGGHVVWDPAPGGAAHVVVHNAAEARASTHLLAVDTVIRAEERMDRASPPGMLYLADVPVPPTRPARIVSYADGAYVVQPVRREAQGFVDDGPEIGGVVNPGELWDDEAGYLAGPPDFDRYVDIFWTPAGWTILLHPPRMV
jgi:hypothetical protein